MSVSVIICTWNRSTQLAATLSSLAMQTGVAGTPIEVLVVDNNSTDQTPELVASLASDWQLGALRYIFEPRQGKQFALNAGIRAAQHKLLLFSDDDVSFTHNWIAATIDLFRLGGVELAGGKNIIQWPDCGPPDWYVDEFQAVLGGVDLGPYRLLPAPGNFAPAGGNLAATRQLFEKVGLFSETHFRHMDHEFGMRCQEAGVCIVYEPVMVIQVPVDERCLSRRYFQRWAFKAGIAPSVCSAVGHDGGTAVPRWLYRQLVEDGCAVMFSRLRLGPQSFTREMRLWRAWGTVCNAWYAMLWPRRHAEWVQRNSQKKNNAIY